MGLLGLHIQLFFFFLRNIILNLIPLIWKNGPGPNPWVNMDSKMGKEYRQYHGQPGQEFQLSTIQWSKSTLARMDKHLFITMKGQMFPLVNRWILLGIIHTIFVPLKLNHQRFQLASRSINWSYYMSQVYVKLQERPIENHTQSQRSPFFL